MVSLNCSAVSPGDLTVMQQLKNNNKKKNDSLVVYYYHLLWHFTHGLQLCRLTFSKGQ